MGEFSTSTAADTEVISGLRSPRLAHEQPHPIDQNNAVAHNHSQQRQDPEDRHETERFVEKQQCGDDADKAHRDNAQNEEQQAETLQLHHQQRDRHEQHQRNDGAAV
jgi:hypothetical protein